MAFSIMVCFKGRRTTDFDFSPSFARELLKSLRHDTAPLTRSGLHSAPVNGGADIPPGSWELQELMHTQGSERSDTDGLFSQWGPRYLEKWLNLPRRLYYLIAVSSGRQLSLSPSLFLLSVPTCSESHFSAPGCPVLENEGHRIDQI